MKNKRYKITIKALLLLMGMFSTSNLVYAENITKYEASSMNLKASQTRGLTSKVKMRAERLQAKTYNQAFPPAFVLEENWQGSSSASKIPKGTILYRHYYGGVYFYSPLPPKSYITDKPTSIKRADGTTVTIPANTQWLNPRWGPNQDSSTALSGSNTKILAVVKSIKVSKDTVATDIKGNNVATIPAGTYTNNSKNEIHIIGYTSQGIYLRHPKGYSNVVRINKNYTITQKDDFFQNGQGNNLKKYLQSINTPGFGFFQVSSNTSHELWSGNKTWGEWRHLGFNNMGDIIPNPLFPPDGYDHFTLSAYKYYPWAENPWNTDIFQRYIGSKTSYDNPNYTVHYQYKVDAIKQTMATKNLYGDDILGETDYNKGGNTYTYWMNRLSLRSHPVYEGKVYGGAKKDKTRYRTIMDEASEYRDLYVSKMEVYGKGASAPDEENRLLGMFVRNSASDKKGTATIIDKLLPGETYTVKVYIKNDSDLHTLSDNITSHTVAVNNKKADEDVSLMKIEEVFGVKFLGTEEGLAGKTESKYVTMTFKINENTQNPNVDVHTWVGRPHWGIDNTDDKNDKGYMKFDVEGIKKECDPSIEVCDIPDIPEEPKPGCVIGRNVDYSGNASNNSSRPTARAVCPPTGAESGDLVWDEIQLIDESGKVVYSTKGGNREAIKPGRKYKIKGKGSYQGDELVYPEYEPYRYTIDGKTYSGWRLIGCFTRSTSFSLDYVYHRKLGTKDELEKVSKSAGSVSIMLTPGAKFEFTSDYILFDRPWGNFEVQLTHGDSQINRNKMNDCFSALVDDDYDIKIENARVVSHTEYIQEEKKEIVYQVVYDAILEVPPYVKEDEYETQINTQITLGTHKEVVKDQLKIGRNDGLSHVIKVPVHGSGTLNGTVNLNFDKASFEYKKQLGEGDYTNNPMNIKTEVKLIANPNTKFNKPSSNTSDSNKGGSANNNCMIPLTSNKWTNQNRVHTWTSTTTTYTGDGPLRNKTYSFRKYSSKTTNSSNNYSESYTIDHIMFKSKVTKDKKLGANGDGWVDLLSASESNLGLIKAGYGFELKIIVTFKTDASNPAKQEFISDGQSGTTVTEQNSGINLIEDIYLELPGDNANRKVLSATGYAGTRKGLIVDSKEGVEGNNKYIRYTFSIKEANTSGVKESGKIFIPINLKDGIYPLNIYTPPQTGVLSTNKQYSINRSTKAITKRYTDLCDRKQVNIKVQGSSTDDLNSHDTQK